MTFFKTPLKHVSLNMIALICVLFLPDTAHSNETSCPEYAVYHTTTPQRPASSDKYLQSLELKASDAKNADIILLGDSLTRSWKSKSLEKKLNGLKVLNLGIGADRTQQIIWRLKHMNMSDYNPKFVVLWIGTNNLRTDPACAISEGIIEIIDILTNRWSESTIIVLETPPRGLDFSAYMPERLEIYDAAKEKYTDKNVSFLNVDDALTCGGMRKFSDEYHERIKIYKNVPSPCASYKKDLLHLTNDAYEILNDRIADVVGSK